MIEVFSTWRNDAHPGARMHHDPCIVVFLAACLIWPRRRCESETGTVQVDANAAANDYRRAKLATSGGEADRTPVASPAEDSRQRATGGDLSFPQGLNGDHGNDQAAGTDQGGPSPGDAAGASRGRRGEPSLYTDMSGLSALLVQMWQGAAEASPVPTRTRQR